MTEATIARGYRPGSIGRVTAMHGEYYAREWGFSRYFESKVATGLCDFLERYVETRDGFWTASLDGRIEGAIAIDGTDAETDGAHLRWFIVSDVLRGTGVGGRLIKVAMDFCREQGYSRVYLETFAGLEPARHLYEKVGFELTREWQGTQWGTPVREQRFECELRSEY